METGSRKTPEPVAVRARWVLPIDQPPIQHGVVTIVGSRILTVGENSSGRPPRDLGNVALIPGLVNAHTHLEFSLLEQPLCEPAVAFSEWIACVVEHRRTQNKKLMVETDGFQRFRRRAAETGLQEIQASGTAAIGEIATPGWPRECFPAHGLHVTVFLELLGLAADAEDRLLAMAQSFVADVQDIGSRLKPGLSPHAPYTASPRLVEKACQISADERVPVAMHLAESREELELLASHRGGLVETLEKLKAWHPEAVPQGRRPLDYLETLALAHRTLVIHGNYLAPDEIDFLARCRERMSVVYCPRTHAYFRHDHYPLEKMLAAGVNMAVGTDSLASNPDLSLLAELRQVARLHTTISLETILRLGTLGGAEALGISREMGSIAPGKRSLLTVIDVAADATNPLQAILNTDAAAQPLSTLLDQPA